MVDVESQVYGIINAYEDGTASYFFKSVRRLSVTSVVNECISRILYF